MENLDKPNSKNKLAINKVKITRVRTEFSGPDDTQFPGPETLMTISSSRVSNII